MLEKSPHEFLAYCALVRVLKRKNEFLWKSGGVLIIRVRALAYEEFELVADFCFGTSKYKGRARL